MHDPMILAFRIHWPIGYIETLPNGKPFTFYHTLLTIWHHDPETDGTDDSCGWSYPNLSERDRKIVDDIANLENYSVGFSSPYLPVTLVDPRYDYPQQTMGDCLASVAWVWQQIARYRDNRRQLTAGEWWRCNNLAINPADNLRHTLTDFEDDGRVKRFVSLVMRCYLQYHRPWYHHPKWHFWHWEIQWDFLRDITRQLESVGVSKWLVLRRKG